MLRSKFTMTDLVLWHSQETRKYLQLTPKMIKRGVKHIHTIHVCPLENDDDDHASLRIENVILYR